MESKLYCRPLSYIAILGGLIISSVPPETTALCAFVMVCTIALPHAMAAVLSMFDKLAGE